MENESYSRERAAAILEILIVSSHKLQHTEFGFILLPNNNVVWLPGCVAAEHGAKIKAITSLDLHLPPAPTA